VSSVTEKDGKTTDQFGTGVLVERNGSFPRMASPPAGSGQGISDLATRNLRLPSKIDRADKRHLG
jgi:hypothetical protein